MIEVVSDTKPLTYHRLYDLIKSCWTNADPGLVAANRDNSAWLMEYLSIYLCRHGYPMYEREWTALRLCKRHIEYRLDIIPQLENIKMLGNYTDSQMSKVLGFKTLAAYRNCTNPGRVRFLITGWFGCYNTLVSDRSTISRSA